MHPTVNTQLDNIVRLLEEHPDGLSRLDIGGHLEFTIPARTLQRRLSKLVLDKRIIRHRRQNIFIYRAGANDVQTSTKKKVPRETFSEKSEDILKFLETPTLQRPYVHYNREFLENYRPNVTMYLQLELRERLLRHGLRFDEELAAGTYANQINQRLLIDLSYNSSRLEGNTYSIIDTERLIQEGIGAEGKLNKETIMIMNHKEAIQLIVENAREIEINSHTIKSIHGLLSQDLLPNPNACGTLRHIPVGMGKSRYKPLNNPHVLREQFYVVLSKAQSIIDPFEQSFFLLVHLSYLQAFEDVNKRTSRITCNIPFVKRNLCPLSFTGVSTDDYIDALLAVYEVNEVQPLIDVFEQAYIQSCRQYDAVKESVETIDSYPIKYRRERKEVIRHIIIGKLPLNSKEIHQKIEEFSEMRGIPNPAKFKRITLQSLQSITQGARPGVPVTESQLQEWVDLHST